MVRQDWERLIDSILEDVFFPSLEGYVENPPSTDEIKAWELGIIAEVVKNAWEQRKDRRDPPVPWDEMPTAELTEIVDVSGEIMRSLIDDVGFEKVTEVWGEYIEAKVASEIMAAGAEKALKLTGEERRRIDHLLLITTVEEQTNRDKLNKKLLEIAAGK
jgi:hypothetical protein